MITLRYFQPHYQQAFARILSETNSNYSLSPGLLSIEPPASPHGFSGYFSLSTPPSLSCEDFSSPPTLHWFFPPNKESKSLSSSFLLSSQPFYPAPTPYDLRKPDFESYIDQFLSHSKLFQHIFTLPIDFIDSPLIDPVLDSDCSFFLLSGFHSLLFNQRKLSQSLFTLRQRLSPDIALFLPGPIPPSYFSFLVYSGIDFFDNSFAYYLSPSSGYFLTLDRYYPLDSHPPCYCPHCSSNPPNLFSHNNFILQNAISRIYFALEEGTLRTLVEQDIHNSVTFAAALKHFDSSYGSYIRNRTPLLTSAPVKCIGNESIYRPSITEFRSRIRDFFTPDPFAHIVILFPCSSRKPYSLSFSHRRFIRALRKGVKSHRALLSEIIITSPLSVVPRELEDLYPSRFYDIPVSGDWCSEEISLTSDLLLSVLDKYPSDLTIINHTHGSGYTDVLNSIKQQRDWEIIHTSPDSHPTSYDSLDFLTSTLTSVIRSYTPERRIYSDMIIRLRTIANHQFGKGVGDILFPADTIIKGRFPRDLQIFLDNEQIATLRYADGFLTLDPTHAQKIIDLTYAKMEFATTNIRGSSIFAVGIVKADPRIRPLDEILITKDNLVLATGTAVVAGCDMNKMTSGIAAQIRKKRSL